MFWGLEVKPKKAYSQSPPTGTHLSQAVLGPNAKEGKNYLIARVDGKKYAVCVLSSPHNEQATLDLYFAKGQTVTFTVYGESTIFLTGYYMPPDEDEEISSDDEGGNNLSTDFDELEHSKTDDDTDANTEANARGVVAKPVKDKKKALSTLFGQPAAGGDDDSEEDDDDYVPSGSEEGDHEIIEEGEGEGDSEDGEGDSDVDDEEAAALREMEAASRKAAKPAKAAPKPVVEDDEEGESEYYSDEEEEAPAPVAGKRKQEDAAQAGSKKMKKADGKPKIVVTPATPAKQEKTPKKQEKKEKGGLKAPKSANRRKLKNGLELVDHALGGGKKAEAGRRITVHYTGKFENGKTFDSGRNFTFRLGQGEVIKGWDLGFANMMVGGKRTLIVPPKLGYGHVRSGPIPPNSTLVFDVELVKC